LARHPYDPVATHLARTGQQDPRKLTELLRRRTLSARCQ
jgi:hypothetical protein